MPPTAIIEPENLPQHDVLDREAILRINPQRFEMEQLTGVTLLDADNMIAVGYKDITEHEFWCRGHMPDFPLMPGVIMCEAAAQLCSIYTTKNDLLTADFVGFGGMENVRFRGLVRPPGRFWLVAKTDRHSTRRMKFSIQGFFEQKMVFHGDIIGVPISRQGDAPDTDD